jgi:hemerythrin-like domain-containing protein
LAEAVEKYEQGREDAKTAIIENARSYTRLLAQHIPKEDNILYPLADKMLTPQDRKEILKEFEKIEKERTREGKHHKYMHLVEILEKELKVV